MKTFSKRALCLLLMLALCAGLLPVFAVSASAVSLEEKQRAVVLTAFAYFDKGRPVQYDSIGLSVVPKDSGGTIRTTHEVAPEYATPDETMFSVCSDFCYQVYYNTFGYKLCGSAIGCYTARMSKFEPEKDPICAYKYDSTKSPGSREQAITDFLAVLQPGDIINEVANMSSGGHAMLYLGDVLGNGTKYLIQCAGYKYDTTTGQDTIECSPGMIEEVPGKLSVNTTWGKNGGAISLDSAEEYLRAKYTKSANAILSAIRPLNVITDDEYPLTDSAKTRLQYPRLAINRTANASRFKDIEAGGTLTLSIALSNYSKQSYTVPVTEVIPEGVTLQKVSDNGKVDGKNISWSVQLPAGGSKTLTVDYTVTAKRNELLTLGGGKVGEIPSNTLYIPVGGKHLTAEEEAKLTALAEGTYKDVPQDIADGEFAQRIYNDVLKLNVTLPSSKTFVKEVLKRGNAVASVVYAPREDLQGQLLTYKNMLVYDLCGGFYWGEMDSLRRVLDLRCDYLRPGDILVKIRTASTPATSKVAVYAGNKKFLECDNKTVGVTDFFALQESHIYQLFYVLRPTMAFDDIHVSTAPEKEFKFTDVKQSDWFYTYVKDLVNDGTVNGMTETTFVPNGTLTYGQALKLIALAVGETEPAKSGTHWASGYLTLAKSKGWLSEDVNLDGTITRLALCRIAAKAKGLTEQPETNPFTDTDDKDVLALNKVGVINGMTETTFQPEGQLTRAQISKIIWVLRSV